MPLHIDTLSDPRVAVFRDIRDRDLRGRERLFIAESELVLRRLLRSPERIHAVLASPERFAELAPEMDGVIDDEKVFVASEDLMTAIAGFHVHRGVLAAGLRPRPWELTPEATLEPLRDQPSCRLLVAVGITNVDNIGALFRNAAAFGVDGILLDPTCCDPLYRKAIRVSMGHVFGVPYAVATRWPEDLLRVKTRLELEVVAAEVTPTSVPLDHIVAAPRLAIVVGSEATGLDEDTLAVCDHVGEIPMAAGVPSLNVAVAAAVFLQALRPPVPEDS